MTFWRRFLAWTRWSKTAVCEGSAGRDEWSDYHDYPDSVAGEPWHFYLHTCKQCGKGFYI
jgi:hypothetical protein